MAKYLDSDGLTHLKGKMDETYAKVEHTHDNYVPTERTVNEIPLSENVTLAASDVGAAVTKHWDIDIKSADWIESTADNTFAGITAKYEVSKECLEMTGDTDISSIQFTGGDRMAAATWQFLRPGTDAVKLYSTNKPNADFMLRLTEVK